MSTRLETILKQINIDSSTERPFYVIYLEDEEDSREIITNLFEQLNFTCLATSDPQQALAWVRRHGPDLAFILSDFRMPAMNGFEFRAAVRAIDASAPFVIYSGFVDTEMALRGLDLKIAGFLDKPLEQDTFLALIEKEVIPRVIQLREDRELMAAFVAETDELIEQSEELILELDGASHDKEPLNRFFGMVHTIKGASSFFEPKHLHRFAHAFEDVLKELQRGERKLSPEVTTFLLFSMDIVKELLGEFRTGEYRVRDVNHLIAAAMKHLEVATTEPTDETAPENEGPSATKATARPKLNEIKVPMVTLDEFMQLSGEMTVVRNMLNKSLRTIENQFPGDREVANLAELLEELHKVNGSVQSKVTELRKVSMKNVLKPLPRAVRDIAKQLGKSIELTLIGDYLRVDTTIAEVLSNSLLHVVKNSMDHGIEAPAERRAAGKPEAGRVTLECSEKNDRVIIVIEDDGKGINSEAIRKKLRSNGSHSEAEIAALPDAELHLMIFAAGFSTAQQVTDISGRGVGMSMVKDLVQGAGGTIEIDSRSGRGTKFTFSIPVPKSVLITSCLFVRVGAERFGLMQDDIHRSLHVTPAHRDTLLARLEGAYCLNIDREVIPVISLAELLGVPDAGNLTDETRDVHLVVITAPGTGRRAALLVDEILDIEDTVIKALAPQFNPYGLYRGATFMDDRSAGLVLDTPALVERSGGLAKSIPSARKAEVKIKAPEESVLIFELAIPGRYAIDQNLVHRIEELNLAQAHVMGPVRVCAYRGGVLSIVDLDARLNSSIQAPIDEGASSLVVVVNSGEHLLGFAVRSIVDVATTERFASAAVAGSPFISGQILWNQSVVNKIDWTRLAETTVRTAA